MHHITYHANKGYWATKKVEIRSYKRWKCSEKSLILARKRKVSYVFIVSVRLYPHDEKFVPS